MSEENFLFHTETYAVQVGTHDTFSDNGTLIKSTPIYEVINKVTGVIEVKDYVLPNVITACIDITNHLNDVVKSWQAKNQPIVSEPEALSVG